MCCMNPNDGRVRYAQMAALLGEMRRHFTADEIKTWPLPGGALMFALYSDDDETPIERGYISADGIIRTYLTAVAA